MKGIDKITSRILADAEAECAAVRSESDERCAAIKADAEKKAQEEYWRLVREGVKDTEQRVQRMDRTARLEAKKSVLNMKQEVVSKACELAKQKIAELPERDYVGFLAREASAAAITGQEEVIFCERDRRSVGSKAVRAANDMLAARGLPGMLTLSDSTREMAGGLVLRQGDIEVNCTVDTLLELSRGELAASVAEVLFEG